MSTEIVTHSTVLRFVFVAGVVVVVVCDYILMLGGTHEVVLYMSLMCTAHDSVPPMHSGTYLAVVLFNVGNSH